MEPEVLEELELQVEQVALVELDQLVVLEAQEVILFAHNSKSYT